MADGEWIVVVRLLFLCFCQRIDHDVFVAGIDRLTGKPVTFELIGYGRFVALDDSDTEFSVVVKFEITWLFLELCHILGIGQGWHGGHSRRPYIGLALSAIQSQ
jgi:hypothetical protein